MMKRRIFSIAFLSLIALSFALANDTQKVYLSGTGSDNTVDWEFYCTKGMNSGKWSTISVPSCWEQEGFGAYNYGYDKQDGRADEQGMYKYSFSAASDWKGKLINIVFEGVMTDAEVKINGKSVGPKHQGAFYRFRYDVSKLLKYGDDNLLEVTVSKVSSNESVNKAERNADYWIFGGIFRPVYLEILPTTNIKQLIMDTPADGVFKANVYLTNPSKKAKVKAQIFSSDGKKVGEAMEATYSSGDMVSLSTEIKDPQLWSPEFPNLYQVKVDLEVKGETVHSVTKKIGFRTLEIRERDGVYLNGVKFKFKGVNRHSFNPETGRTLSKDNILDDIFLIKDMNMNAVRNSHYPADAFFYDACDSLGIIVLDELGGWHDAYDTEIGKKLIKEMMYKNMNHPCVLIWINGNEGGHNPDLVPVFKDIDIQKRPVLEAWRNFGGMDTKHYRDYDYGVGCFFQGHDVVMPTEFLHGMYDGGHGAGLEDFWEDMMWRNPLSAGGFLWDFADEAIVRKDKDGFLDQDGNHGPDGIVGPFHEKEGSYFTIKEVWAPVHFEHKEITAAFDGKFRVENRYQFTNLDECSFKYEFVKYPIPGSDEENAIVSGDILAPDIEPLEKGFLSIDLPSEWNNYDFLYITAYNPQGKNIFTWSWPVQLPADVASQMVIKTAGGDISAEEGDTLLTVNAGGVTTYFSKNSGLLLGAKNSKGNISLSNGPILCEGESVFKELTYTKGDNKLIVTSVYTDTSVMQMQEWTIYPSGWMELDIAYSPKVERHDLLGINFSYPEEKVKGITWMGSGPYRVWKNRMKGNKLGVWQKDYNNTITGQSEYIYPEFKGFHANMYWLKVETEEPDFTVVCPDEDIFFRMYTPVTPEDPYNTAPKFPEGDISFMQGITPMGTKCLQTYRMGPMSDQNIYYSYGGDRPLKMKLYFNFTENQ